MPTGAINYQTLADTCMAGSHEDTFHDFYIDASRLVNGINVIAVEIHQCYPGSSDISFDFELSASFQKVYLPTILK